ncbi:MAG: putative FAD-dependent dehydrogenase [Flavobacteriales bacterium]|jgi:uncharacterized FAD-dependent dehydrogenase
MQKDVQISLTPDRAFDRKAQINAIARKLEIQSDEISGIKLVRRSIDARKKRVVYEMKFEVYVGEEVPEDVIAMPKYPKVDKAAEVIIVGGGPAGIFAALRLIELGIKPIVLERGQDVRNRRRDLKAINQDHVVNPESNYCFGEGGAGTYSDGKLYTRSTKRGDVRKVLESMVAHGASENILIDAHPHIGTNKLPQLVTSLNESILNAGGEIHFNTKVTDFILEGSKMTGVVTASGDKITGKGVILATGHSARDIYELLHEKGILIEAKPFAMGVRIEHPQPIIDSIQYHCTERGDFLPAASYSVVNNVNGRGVYSFCMCPGGFIVPSATAPGEVVVNGMSPSKRDSVFANSGMVVAIEVEDMQEYASHGPLAGLRYQQAVEKAAWKAGGETQAAPAQRMVDFFNRKSSGMLNETSYQPGLTSAPLHEILPKQISGRLQKSFQSFGKKMHGYFTNQAQILGVESRTSSPVRIPRDKETLVHPQIEGLYPCAEGAGYAGGIVSAAIDGERCAEAIAKTV